MAVYDTDGRFVRSFGEETLKCAWDITAANDGRVMVVERDGSCVHIFSEDGDYLEKFKLQGRDFYLSIAFHRASEHVVMAGAQQNCLVPWMWKYSPKMASLCAAIKSMKTRIYRIGWMTVT